VIEIGFALRFVLHFALRFVLHFAPGMSGRRPLPLGDWHRGQRDSLAYIAPQGLQS
jgi:hypothetical protein